MPATEPDNEATGQLDELQRLATLGTLTAGLMHDLNNPATALIRAARQLPDAVGEWQALARGLGALDLTQNEQAAIDKLHAELPDRVSGATATTPLARSANETELLHWLNGRDVPDGWRLAPLLVDAGWSVAQLGEVARALSPDHLASVLAWLSQGCLVHQLLHELSLSALAISEMSTAVQSQMGRRDPTAARMESIHASLERALVILRHQLRGVTVVRDLTDLSPDGAISSEFNQVLTNLIDNAATALDGAGTLTIRARVDGGWLTIEVEDDGPGISEDVRVRLFEPFVSTKAPRESAGLGLHISRRIARRHGGDISLDSRPGQTRFTVQIPTTHSTGGPDD